VAFRAVVLSSDSPLAMRGMIRGDSALDLPGVGGGVGEREFGAEAECAPSTPEGQVPGTTKESSGAASVCWDLAWSGGIASSSVAAREDGCVELECCDCSEVAAVAELVACDLEDGTDVRVAAFELCGTLDRLPLCRLREGLSCLDDLAGLP